MKKIVLLCMLLISIIGCNYSFAQTKDSPSHETPYQTWQKFYEENFNMEFDFTEISIPAKPSIKGKYRLLVIAEGISLTQVYTRMNTLFACSNHFEDDIDEWVTKYDIRTNKTESYAVWISDEVEPDKEFQFQSVDDVDPDQQIGVTLLEAMIHEMSYFKETGSHLNQVGVTFCSGSRYYKRTFVPGILFVPEENRVIIGRLSLDGPMVGSGIRKVYQ